MSNVHYLLINAYCHCLLINAYCTLSTDECLMYTIY